MHLLECELYACLTHVNVLVVGQEVLLQTMVSVVEHQLNVLVERVVHTNGVRVDFTTTNTAAGIGPILHVTIGIVLVATYPLLNFDILLTIGAGDIVNLLPQICEQVKKQSR